MKILQIFLIALASLSGCAKKADKVLAVTNNTQPNTAPMTSSSDTITYLALGDSYTIGQSVPLDQSYPYQLSSALNKNSIKAAPPTIIATTGWTTDELINAISSSGITSKKFGIVTLLIGVNDQYRGLSQSDYGEKFAQVLNTAIDFANGNPVRVFVLSIPDYGVTPFANGQEAVIGPQIDQFNGINRTISLKAGVNYLDITQISRTAATDPSLIASDGLHPSAKMYQLWVNLLEPMVAAQIKK